METTDSSRARGGELPPRLPPGVAERGFLARLPKELICELIQSAHSVSYPTGSLIETPARAGLALIVSGALRYYLSVADGRQLTVGYLGPGKVVGTVQKEPGSLVRLQVIAPTRMLHLHAEHVQSLMQRRPDLMRALLDESIQGLHHSFRVLAASAFMSVRARVARDIVERARLAGQLQVGMHLSVTHQALADATGTVREVVARELRKLRREEVISTSGGGITIIHPEALTRAAGYVT
jgi:CRP/FNR family transcriptional regulator, cyclic AMP receptor protein